MVYCVRLKPPLTDTNPNNQEWVRTLQCHECKAESCIAVDHNEVETCDKYVESNNQRHRYSSCLPQLATKEATAEPTVWGSFVSQRWQVYKLLNAN